MRLRYVLPAIEIAASVAFVFVPLCRYLPNYRPRGPDGTEIVCFDNCPPLPNLYGIDTVTFVQGVNLPGVVVVVPILTAKWDYSRDRHDYFHDPIWQGSGFAIAGIAVWFFLGRLLDDAIAWHRTRIRPKVHVSDLVFSLATTIVASLAAVALEMPRNVPNSWFALWTAIWVLIGYSGVAMRALQLAQAHKEKTRGSRAL